MTMSAKEMIDQDDTITVGEGNCPTRVEEAASKAWAGARRRATWAWAVVSVWTPGVIIVGWGHWNGWVAVLAALLPLVAAWLLTERVEWRAEQWAGVAKESKTRRVAAALELSRKVGGAVGVVIWKVVLLLVGDYVLFVGIFGAGTIFGINPPLGTEVFCLLGLVRAWTSCIRSQT